MPPKNIPKCCMIIFAITVVLLTLSSCADKKSDHHGAPGDCLTLAFDDINATRTSEAIIYAGESLWEYINGGAEIYHQYKFEEVATAYYQIDTLEMVVDVYKFSGLANAYGLYTTIRPDNPVIISIGIQGFSATNSLTFVKGEFVVRITAFVPGEKTAKSLNQIAGQIESCLAGTEERPNQFTLFPEKGSIPSMDKFYAMSFQGHSFLTEFYSQDYFLNGDTIKLFMTENEAINKFSKWKEAISESGKSLESIQGLPFGENEALIVETFYGQVLAGLKGERLIGMANYSGKHQQFFSDWVRTLP